MECKVKIGVSYEPKWFERRYTQGTYSAKGVAHDEETIWLQHALIGIPKKPCSKRLPMTILVLTALLLLFYFTYA
jgi:hypothetical protein